MTIPIQNIYFLLCYAWDMLEEAQVLDVSSEAMGSATDLIIRVLESGAAHLLMRGLDRGYVAEDVDTETPRGKIQLGDTLKRNLLIRETRLVHRQAPFGNGKNLPNLSH